ATAAPRDLPSFPTRRSSDLGNGIGPSRRYRLRLDGDTTDTTPRSLDAKVAFGTDGVARDDLNAARGRACGHGNAAPVACGDRPRSEEHTSELQSRENLVCRL